MVAPLPAITDVPALLFEGSTSPDTGDLKPAMARALEKFQHLVGSVGGTFELKSAYRPPAYQAHLQQVWFKWMLELRGNREPGCQALRAQVGAEFALHHLLDTQKPVTASDHTRGLAFDAAVVVPGVARLKKRRISLDRLALMAGIQRPDILRDPVHFKLGVARRSRRG
jgi:D-alanyl-D-alanine dipeptidase